MNRPDSAKSKLQKAGLSACLTLVLLAIYPLAYGQHYSAADSAAVYQLLNKADDADYEGKLDDAQTLVRQALTLSQKKGFARGEGFALLKTADLILKKDGTDSLDIFYKKAVTIGRNIKDHFLTGLAYMQQSQQQAQEGLHNEAAAKCNDAILFFKATDSVNYIALAYNHLAYIQERSGEYENASKNNLLAISLFDKVGNAKESANTLGNVAVVYYKLGKKDDALHMFKQSAARRETIADIKGLAATYGNIVTVYMPINTDSARKYLALQLINAEKSGVGLNLAQAYVNQMAILGKEKNFAESLVFEKKAIDLYAKLGDKSKLTYRYINAASISNQMNDSLQAEVYFAKADSLAHAINSKPMLQNLHQARSDFYKNRGNHQQALQHLTGYYTYRDSLINEKTATNIAELQARYDTEKKDNEIARLKNAEKIRLLEIESQAAVIRGNRLESEKKQREIVVLTQQQQLKDEGLKLQEQELGRQKLLAKNNEQQLELARQQNQLRQKESQRERLLRQILLGGAGIAVLLAGVLFSRYRLRQKVKEQQALLAMRDHISKDLHDEIGSTLTSINILSNVSQQALRQDPAQAMEMLRQISAQSRAIQQNMSDIVWAIRPLNEAAGSLETRMREFAAQTLEPLGIDTTMQFDEQLTNGVLPHNRRKDVLLIYKEAVNNIVKHANATNVSVSLLKQNNAIHLQVADNGTWKQNGSSTGTGTKSMAARAQAMGGTLHIHQSVGGTSVELHIPV